MASDRSSSAEDGEPGDPGDDAGSDYRGCEPAALALAMPLCTLLFEAAATLVCEMLFPILHGSPWSDEIFMKSRLAGDSWLAAGCRVRHCALREVLGKLGMPRACSVRHCPLRGHPFLDRPTPIVTLVRFHWSPLW